MADQKIELEIVLDDGSIKKAFGTIRKEAEATQKETSGIFSGLSGGAASLVVLNQGIELFRKFSYAVKETTSAIVGLSLEAEKVRVVNAQFVALTQQAGIATESFDASIRKSIASLIDDEEALSIANQAMIRLGQSAQRLPEIFELARKAAAAGFGDIVSNAEIFIRTIQSGSTRELRRLGITADLTKAQSEFAKSIGLTAVQLTEEQKAFVNSNVILEAASKRFQNVDSSLRSTSDALARFKTASGDAFERFAVAFDKAFGPSYRIALDNLSAGLAENEAAYRANLVEAKNLSSEIKKTEDNLKSLTEQAKTAATESEFIYYGDQISRATKLLDELIKRQKDYQQLNNEQAQRIISFPQFQLEMEMRKKNEEQARQAQEAEFQRQNQLSTFRNQLTQQEVSSRQQSLQYIFDDNQKRVDQEALYQAQVVQIAEQGAQQRLAIDAQFSNAKGFNQDQRDALEIERVNATNAQILAAQKAYQFNALDDFQKFLLQSQKTFSQISSAAKMTLVQGFGSAFAAMGTALAKGEDAMAAFGKAILGTLGDIAMQMGQSFILQGIAYSVNPLTPGMGGPLIAAGIALSVFGGFLKGIAGGSGGAGAGAGSTAGGGGIAAQPQNMGEFNAAAPIGPTQQQASTVVNLTVQGDVFDSDATGSRIVQLINDAFDSKGVVIRGATA